MASNQGNYDNSANAPYWAAASVHLRGNTTNSGTLLYDNTTLNAFYRPKNETVGLFGVDDNEKIVEGGTGSHAGWVLRTTGTGGRAGRIQEETLSVVSSFRSDNNADDAVYPDASAVVTLQPVAVQYVYSNTAYANVVTLSTAVTALPTGAATTYLWQYNTADGALGWTNIANGVAVSLSNTTVSGNTTATLTIAPKTINSCNTSVFRALITVTPPGTETGSTTVTVNTANGQTIVFAGV